MHFAYGRDADDSSQRTNCSILYFPKMAMTTLLTPTCSFRTFQLFHQEVESMSPPLDLGWDLMTVSMNRLWKK